MLCKTLGFHDFPCFDANGPMPTDETLCNSFLKSTDNAFDIQSEEPTPLWHLTSDVDLPAAAATSSTTTRPSPDPIRTVNVVDTVPLHLNADLLSNQEMFLECLGPLLRPNQNQIQHSSNTSLSSTVVGHTTSSPQNDGSVDEVDLTDYQAALWKKRYRELIRFRERHGHCLVPHKWQENLALATWVKRQRYQWKLRQQGKRSTLTTDRLDALSRLGFVWDSHNATWEERFNELVEFKRLHGHTSVPTTYKNHSLSVWVQCQRRQWKLFREDSQRSSAPNCLKEARVARLDALGFIWEPRKQRCKTDEN